MPCDAMSVALIMDKDGTFLGGRGYVLPQAEWQYDGLPAYGVGLYRIPKYALMTPDGTRMQTSVVCPYTGSF